jgi:hypothetical protein
MSKILFDIINNPFKKELSPTTQKLYLQKLNILARAGYDSSDKLWKAPGKVIKIIKASVGEGTDDNAQKKRRLFLTAIFAVMNEVRRTSNNAYYRYYQKCLPNKSGDKNWVKRKDYVSGSESE